MRGGVRLPALVVAIGLLAGCSDPADAVRRERTDAARHPSAAPSPRAASAPKRPGHHKAAAWLQAPATTKTANGLQVRTGALRAGRLTIVVTDVRGHVSLTIRVTRVPRKAVVGHFRLGGVRVGAAARGYGLRFRYRPL